MMNSRLEASYECCRRISGSSGSNFFRSFSLLRPEKRRSMMALYAYARTIDDLSDNPDVDSQLYPNAQPRTTSGNAFRPEELHEWINHLDAPLKSSNFLPEELKSIELALLDTIQKYNIPTERLHEMVRGVSMDLVQPVRMANHQSLDEYCYLVASSVGLACISVWQGDLQSSKQSAIDCGIAFQLTNILRDVAEDARRDRIYLPSDAFEKFGVNPSSWIMGSPNGDWIDMLRGEIDRAKCLYKSGWIVSNDLECDGQRMFSLMWNTYRQLLLQIEREIESVWQHRIRLSRFEKLQLYFQHAFSPAYKRMQQPYNLTKDIGK